MVPGKEARHNPSLAWWADQIERPLSPALPWSQNCFQRPQREAGRCATVNAFIFSMAACAMLFAQKKGPCNLAAHVAWRCQGPWPVLVKWTQVASRSDRRTRPDLAALRNRFQPLQREKKKRPAYWEQSPVTWYYPSTKESGRAILIIGLCASCGAFLGFAGALSCQELRW